MALGKAIPYRATGAGVIAESVSVGYPFVLDSVKIHLSAFGGAVGAVDFTITINSVTGAAYDTLIYTQDMTAVKDILWQPDRPITIANSDVLDIAYANGSNLTYGLEVLYRREL